jgi:hypothetical protein
VPATRTPKGSARLSVAARLVAVAAAAGVLAGCGQIDAALAKQVAIVRFKPGTTLASLLQTRRACAHVPHLRLLPNPLHPGEVRYQASGASGKDLARLQTCLQRFPAVTGVAIQDSAGRDL